MQASVCYLLVLVLLAGCDGCPVEVGSRVSYEGYHGTVAAKKGWGSLTQNCQVGINYDMSQHPDGEDYVLAWKLEKLPEGY